METEQVGTGGRVERGFQRITAVVSVILFVGALLFVLSVRGPADRLWQLLLLALVPAASPWLIFLVLRWVVRGFSSKTREERRAQTRDGLLEEAIRELDLISRSTDEKEGDLHGERGRRALTRLGPLTPEEKAKLDKGAFRAVNQTIDSVKDQQFRTTLREILGIPEPPSLALAATKLAPLVVGDLQTFGDTAIGSAFDGDPERESARVEASRVGFCFGLHVLDRVCFGLFGPDGRAEFMDTLLPKIEAETGWPAGEMRTRYNSIQISFARFKKLLPAEGQGTAGTLFWEFGKTMATDYGASNPAVAALAADAAAGLFNEYVDTLRPLAERFPPK